MFYMAAGTTFWCVTQMNAFSECRERAGLSIEGAAEILNLSVEIVADYERGTRRPLPREIQILSGLALGVSAKKGTSEAFESKVIRVENRGPGEIAGTQGLDGMTEVRPLDSCATNFSPYNPENALSDATKSKTAPLSFYEFFCGGGMVRAGLGPDWECLFANDFDLKKCATYKRNWPAENLIAKDVAGIETSELPGAAGLAWASFPCQDLSLAGMGAGLRGDRSGTFWPFWRLITKLKAEGRAPRIIALENVCGTLTSHGGKDFTAIADALSEADYRFGAMVIDAVDFVPQSRPRLFVIAVAHDISVPKKVLSEDATLLWHPRALQIAQMRLTGKSKESWLWWKLPALNTGNYSMREKARVERAN